MSDLHTKISNIIFDNVHYYAPSGGLVIHGAIDNLVALVEKEALGFAEWLQKNQYECRVTCWAKDGEPYTADKIYKKYKEENK